MKIRHIIIVTLFLLSLFFCSIVAHAVRGAAGNLTVETTPDKVESSGDSFNFNVGSGGFGGGVGESTEDVSWTEDPAGIFGATSVDINVGGTTSVIGGAIVSETEGGLSLVTGDLVVKDVAINDYAQDEYTGVQVNVDVEGIVTGKTDGDIFNSNSYGSIEHSDVGHDKEGVIKGTISGGSVTVGGETQDLATLEEMGINTDADNIITITKDESWEESFKVDLVNVGVVAEQVDNLVNVVQSFTAKVPDHVKAMGDSAEDLYRKAIANGMEKDNLEALVNDPNFERAVEVRNKMTEMFEDESIDVGKIYTQLHAEVLLFANDYVEKNCASGTAVCDTLLAAYGGGKTIENLTANDIYNLMEAIGTAASAGSSVSVQGMGIALAGEELAKAAAWCAAEWLNDVRKHGGDLESSIELKNMMASEDFQTVVEQNGIDMSDWLVKTGFDYKPKLDGAVDKQFQEVLANASGNYVGAFDNFSEQELLNIALNYADTNIIDKGAVFDAIFQKVNPEVDYPEYGYLSTLPLPIDNTLDGNPNDSSWEDQILSYGSHYGLSGVGIFPYIVSNDKNINMGSLKGGYMPITSTLSSDGTLGSLSLIGSDTYPNLNFNEFGNPIYSNNQYMLTRLNIDTYDISSRVTQDNNIAEKVVMHEVYHAKQVQNIYNLVEYGVGPDGKPVDSYVNDSKNRAVLWQFVGDKVYNSGNSNPLEYVLRNMINNGQW